MLVRCWNCHKKEFDEKECSLEAIGLADRWASVRYGYICPVCKRAIGPGKTVKVDTDNLYNDAIKKLLGKYQPDIFQAAKWEGKL